MSLIQSAKMNGHDPYAYIRDVVTRLTTQKASQIEESQPHRWQHVFGRSLQFTGRIPSIYHVVISHKSGLAKCVH